MAFWILCPRYNGENILQHSTCDQELILPSCLWRYLTCTWSITAKYSVYHQFRGKHRMLWLRKARLFCLAEGFVSYFFILKPQQKVLPLSLSNQPSCSRKTWLTRKQKTKSNFDTLMNMKGNFHHPATNDTRALLPLALATFVAFTGSLWEEQNKLDQPNPYPRAAHPEHPQMPAVVQQHPAASSKTGLPTHDISPG